VTGGNVLTGGLISATSTITSGANITGANVLTGGLISATGNVNGGNLISAALVQGTTLSATGNIYGANLIVSSIESVTGNITGGNLLTGGLVSATGTITSAANITGANLLTGGLISATSTITGGNLATGGTASATGNITGGNVLTGGLISAAATITGGNLATGGTASAGGNITGANLLTGGLVSATSTITSGANITGANILTGGSVSATANITGGNVLTGGLISATGNITGGNVQGGNIVLTGNFINDIAANATITVNGANANTSFAVNGSTVGNIFYVSAATGTASFGNSAQITNALVAFNSSTSILIPVGNSTQRPGTGVTGMMRFNTTNNSLEMYNNSTWANVGQTTFTVIADDQFTGNGSATVYTLSSSQTTNSCIVSINGVVQIPTTAYSVSGTTLTFTEAPAIGDFIDVRELTTTTSVTSIAGSGSAVSAATNEVDITGNLIPTANVTYSLGNATNAWSNLYLSGSTIYLGSLQLKATNATTFAVYQADGSTLANVSASGLSVTSITDGTSAYQFAGLNGNAVITAGGANSMVVTSTGANVTGYLTASGNITGGNITTAGQLTVNSGGNVTAIVNGGSNGVGNIGSATTGFNTVFAKATTAQYADLAEKYTADAEYAPGTVVVFGGTAEVTVDAVDSDRRVAGIVSTNPGFLMNEGLDTEFTAAVALTGRVPTMVIGPVRKGDLMVAAGLGRARAEQDPRVGTVIGKALEDFDGAEGTIEVVVGRF
jgi:filamentous hemagglutinin